MVLVKLIISLLLLVAGPALTAAQTPAPIQQGEWRHVDPAFNLTMMELANGNFSAAEAGFQKLAEAYPQDAESPFFLGVSQLRQNKPAQAVDSFKQALDRSPDYVEARWNLLVAAKMAGLDLGQLDGKYRSPLLAGPWARSSVQSPVRFENIGPSSGTAKVDLGRGSAWADYDGDGDLDLFTVGFMSPHALFRNNGDGTFTDVAEQAGLRDPQGGWSALFADYNNDGYPDIYVTRNGWGGRGPNTLYRNNGNGTFTDVTKEAGVDDPSGSFTAAWADYDRDGFIDLYVANGVSSLYGELNSLFHNNGDGTFTNVAIPAGVFEGHHSIGCAWGDADNDGYPDLYVVNYGEDNSYYHNNGNGTFSDWTAKAGVAAPKYGFVAFFFDYDHDGDLDLFVSSWASRMADVARFYLTGEPQGESGQKLYRNKGDGTFEDVTVQAGLQGTYGSMAANFGDIDNDGFPEIYLGAGGPAMERYEPNVLFLNKRNGSFVDVTSSSGTGDLCKGHGQTFADFDGDGNLDIYSPCGGSWSGDRQPNALFRNLGGTSNHWLTIRTRGVKSNRDGIGARVTVTVGGSPYTAEVTSGGGFGSTNSLELEFGLGKATKADKIHIRWPSGQEQEFTNVAADQFVTITEGQKTLTRQKTR
jgi:hypothetical protein